MKHMDFLFGEVSSSYRLNDFNSILNQLEPSIQEYQANRLLTKVRDNKLILNDKTSMPDLKKILAFTDILKIQIFPVFDKNSGFNTLKIKIFGSNGVYYIDSLLCAYKEERIKDLVLNLLLNRPEYFGESLS